MSRRIDIRLRGPVGASLMALVVAMMPSCGGGVVGSGGTGSPTGLAVTVGTVNGFGSVIVDGVSYEDGSASVVEETAPGVQSPADVKLGDRVSVDYQTPGVATVVHLDPTLVGPVASAGSNAQFTVLGQTVTVNASGASGPVTQFGGGYASSLDVRAGDFVEVHAVLARQDEGSYRFQATRVDKLAQAPTYYRLSGVASATGASSFRLGGVAVDAGSAAVLPAGSTLATGQYLSVLASPATLGTGPAGVLSLKAAQVSVVQISASPLVDTLSGAMSLLDTNAKTFTLGGVLVHYQDAAVSPGGISFGNGLYVVVAGVVGSDASLAATSVTVRDAGSDSESELKGNLSGYSASSATFAVRGVSVDASTATLANCPATGLSNGQFVDVQGTLIPTGVKAATVQCSGEPAGATVERSGVAGSVDSTGKTFVLKLSDGTTVPVAWSANTYFGDVTPSTLAGRTVQVQGQFSGSTLNASKIEVDD